MLAQCTVSLQSFLTWLAVLTNTALVYLFRPTSHVALDTTLNDNHLHTSIPIQAPRIESFATNKSYKDLILPAILFALAASHVYFFARMLIRHIVSRIAWRDSDEEKRAAESEQEVKRQYLKSMGLDRELDRETIVTMQDKDSSTKSTGPDGVDMTAFWKRDEGMDEIMRTLKEA